MTHRIVLAMLCLVSALSLGAQQQPIDFPHNKHIEQGLDCIDCHIHADTGSAATLPSVNKCMLCHEKVAVEGAGVKALREYAERKREVPWVRVYGFARTAHVKFRHAPHARAKIECSRCHGQVTTMTVATRAVIHNMGTCVTCHRENNADDDCAACHY